MALSLSLLVSYTRAKGDALGVNLAGIGVGERSERLVVLIVTSLLGSWGSGSSSSRLSRSSPSSRGRSR